MRVIALVDGPGVVRRNLEYLEHRVPEPAARGHPRKLPTGQPLIPSPAAQCPTSRSAVR